jgi:hypothetical protein
MRSWAEVGRGPTISWLRRFRRRAPSRTSRGSWGCAPPAATTARGPCTSSGSSWTPPTSARRKLWQQPYGARLGRWRTFWLPATYSRRRLKERLYASGLKERRCELCGQGETWRDRRMSLILDHINGIADDNRLENLRIVCPNCNATLETHCGRRSRNPLVEVACAGCEEPFTPRRRTQRYCSRLCGSRASKPGPRPAVRRARRPPFDELLRLIEAEGYSAVGRRFGVSDNAIRRWRRDYERAVGEDRPAPPRPNEPPELST